MIYFGIPLRSRASARDWDVVVEDFRRTLASCLAQTDSRIGVIVACNEIPFEPQDERVEMLPLPQFYRQPGDAMRDKGLKIAAIAKRIREIGGGTLMLVDADDLVSNRISAHVHDHPQVDAFFVRNGYEWNRKTNSVEPVPFFYRLCGTCAAIRYTPEELPAEISLERDGSIVRAGHRNFLRACRQAGKSIGYFPFPAAVYITHTEQNDRLNRVGQHGVKRRIIQFLGRFGARRVTPKDIESEFGAIVLPGSA